MNRNSVFKAFVRERLLSLTMFEMRSHASLADLGRATTNRARSKFESVEKGHERAILSTLSSSDVRGMLLLEEVSSGYEDQTDMLVRAQLDLWCPLRSYPRGRGFKPDLRWLWLFTPRSRQLPRGGQVADTWLPRGTRTLTRGTRHVSNDVSGGSHFCHVAADVQSQPAMWQLLTSDCAGRRWQVQVAVTRWLANHRMPRG
ncbi:hypothetical protein Tco_0127883 [Tanacetum coccineum]